MIDNNKEYILCAAIRRKVPRDCKPYHEGTNDICKIEIGYRHHDIYQRFNNSDDYDKSPLSFDMDDQGFYTSHGRFVNRYEGMKIAYEAGQVSEKRALDKSWHKHDYIRIVDEKGKTSDEIDKEKYNMLFSEDLYGDGTY